MEIKQILPGNGWIAVFSGGANGQPRVRSVAAWALYDNNVVGGLVVSRDGALVDAEAEQSSFFLGYAANEAEVEDYQALAEDVESRGHRAMDKTHEWRSRRRDQ